MAAFMLRSRSTILFSSTKQEEEFTSAPYFETVSLLIIIIDSKMLPAFFGYTQDSILDYLNSLNISKTNICLLSETT